MNRSTADLDNPFFITEEKNIGWAGIPQVDG